MSTSLDKLNAKIFSQHLHAKFTLNGQSTGPVTLELVEVLERDPSPQIELFSLQFRGPSMPRLAQQTHRLEHDKLGAFEIFLTAVGAVAEEGILYESVFHRFRKLTP
jgi:hypothetical protein